LHVRTSGPIYDALVVKDNGFIGMGTTEPTSQLELWNSTPNVGTFIRVSAQGAGGVYDSLELGNGDYSINSETGIFTGKSWNITYYTDTRLIFQRFDSGTTPKWQDKMTLDTSGNLWINGTISKGGGNFLIDHPLDPRNKVLRHSFVESPDMANIYKGTAVFDGNGEASIKLPVYFEALNKDFTYQVEVVGTFAPAYIKEEIKNNRFVVAGGRKGLKVCWTVMGTRKDAYALKHPIVIEEEKGGGGASGFRKGEYIHPDSFGAKE
jgi:hypothetical protein